MRRVLAALKARIRAWLVLLALTGLFGCARTPGTGPENCEPTAFYGPMPCRDDQECVEAYGREWYCLEDNVFYDGCGNPVAWPYCDRNGCEPAAYYGPPPCTGDASCLDAHGAGWYCDEANRFDDGCGDYVSYAICRDAECAPMVSDGLQPCTTDASCVNAQGDGWYCDRWNVFHDDCGNQYDIAACKPEP